MVPSLPTTNVARRKYPITGQRTPYEAPIDPSGFPTRGNGRSRLFLKRS